MPFKAELASKWMQLASKIKWAVNKAPRDDRIHDAANLDLMCAWAGRWPQEGHRLELMMNDFCEDQCEIEVKLLNYCEP